MTLLLAGDIGGTKTILQLFRWDGAGRQAIAERTYASGEFTDLVPLVEAFRAEIGVHEAIAAAAFGVAGPVVGGRAHLTNLGWNLVDHQLADQLGIGAVMLLNDFVAIGWGVGELADDQLCTLQEAPVDPSAPVAILGAGTGLGECFVVPGGRGPIVCGSEGAHADFAPRSDLEVELMAFLRRKYAIEHVSVERVVSGQGVAAIYEFLAERHPEQATLTPGADLAARVSTAAQDGSDPLAVQAMTLFVEAYAAEAGNLALKLLPYGGIYLAGGIAPKNLALLQQPNFITAFRDKGRLSNVMAWFPIRVVLEPRVGLLGAARAATQLLG